MTAPTSGGSPAPETSPQPVPSPELEKTAAALVDNGGAVQQAGLELRQCVITAVNLAAATCSVAIGGDDAADAVPNVHYLSNYKPTVGDTCWVLVNGPDLLALDRDGKFGAAAWAGMGRSQVAASETRNNAAYGDLATVGPTVNTTIPASGRLLVCVSADVQSPVAGNAAAFMSFAISGSHTLAAADTNALMTLTYDQGSHYHSCSGSVSTSGSFSGSGSTSSNGSCFISGSVSTSGSYNGQTSFSYSYSATEIIASRVALLTGLTPGSATVTAKYRSTGGTGVWEARDIWVLPL